MADYDVNVVGIIPLRHLDVIKSPICHRTLCCSQPRQHGRTASATHGVRLGTCVDTDGKRACAGGRGGGRREAERGGGENAAEDAGVSAKALHL